MNRFFLLVTLLFTYLSTLSAKEYTFPFSNDQIDVVIPCVEKDLLTVNLCIQGIRENGANIRRIIVVSSKQFTSEAEWFDESHYPFSFQDVATALAKDDPSLTKELLREGSRAGWYYQQLLKLYAPLVIPDISPNVLVLDADTIFLNPVRFLNDHNGGMYNPGWEYYLPYFQHAAYLIPGFYKCFHDYSGISHHMIFQRPVIELLLKEVENQYQAPFWKTFCLLVDPNELFRSGASEYEIYFNYLFARTDQASIRLLEWSNIERMSEIEGFKKRGFHYVSLHSYNRRD